MTVDREFKGKNLEAALNSASSALGIAEPDLDYEIVDQGRPGLFGLGARSVRIRVMPPVHQELDPRPRRRRRGRGERPERAVSKPMTRSPRGRWPPRRKRPLCSPPCSR